VSIPVVGLLPPLESVEVVDDDDDDEDDDDDDDDDDDVGSVATGLTP
jgi:hypothetical protein